MTSTQWSNNSSYDNFMGKWSKLVGHNFLIWLANSCDVYSKSWLDVGCATGPLTFEIIDFTNPKFVLGIDPSIDYLPKNSTSSRVFFKPGNSTQIPAMSEIFDFVVSGLALNFMDDKISSIKEMLRVLKTDGCLALYVWDYSGQMDFLRLFWDAARQINPNASTLDEGILFPICKKPALIELFKNCHLKDIDVTEIIIETNFSNFDDYWNPFLGGQGPAGNYVLSLNESERDLLRNRIMENLLVSSNEPLHLKARAFAILGKK